MIFTIRQVQSFPLVIGIVPDHKFIFIIKFCHPYRLSLEGFSYDLADQFKDAVPLGVTKVNIDTDGRLVWTRVHREYFRDHPEQFDFRKPGTVFMPAYADFIVDKSHKLLSFGKLPEVREALT